MSLEPVADSIHKLDPMAVDYHYELFWIDFKSQMSAFYSSHKLPNPVPKWSANLNWLKASTNFYAIQSCIYWYLAIYTTAVIQYGKYYDINLLQVRGRRWTKIRSIYSDSAPVSAELLTLYSHLSILLDIVRLLYSKDTLSHESTEIISLIQSIEIHDIADSKEIHDIVDSKEIHDTESEEPVIPKIAYNIVETMKIIAEIETILGPKLLKMAVEYNQPTIIDKLIAGDLIKLPELTQTYWGVKTPARISGKKLIAFLVNV